MNNYVETIKNSIKLGRIELALSQLEEYVNKLKDEQFIKETILIFSSYNYHKNNYKKGFKNLDDEINLINNKILMVLENIKEIYAQHESTTHTKKNLDSKSNFSLKDRIINSKHIDILSHSCKGILDDYSHHITESILNGAKVRILYIKPNSDAFKLMMSHTRVESIKEDLSKTQKRVDLIKKSIRKLDISLENNIITKVITWIPSSNLILFDKDETRGIASVKVNPLFYSTPLTERINPFLVSKKEDPSEFDYYRIQFEHLWKYPDCTIGKFKEEIEYEGRKILN